SAISQRLLSRYASQGLQEIDDRVDLLLGQNAVAPERRHDGQWIAPGLIGQDRDEITPIGILAFDVLELWPDRSGQVAALDLVAGQAVALAAGEGELFAIASTRLGSGGPGGHHGEGHGRSAQNGTDQGCDAHGRTWRTH